MIDRSIISVQVAAGKREAAAEGLGANSATHPLANPHAVKRVYDGKHRQRVRLFDLKRPRELQNLQQE